VITVPEAANSTSSSLADVAPMRSETVRPTASSICEASVRFQTRSYSACSSRESSDFTSSGVRNVSPAGRMASCASWAFATARPYLRGFWGTYSGPKSSCTCRRVASSAASDSVVESVRMYVM